MARQNTFSTMISKEEVQHIANLARLRLTDEEIKEMQKDLDSILDYVEKLQEVDTEGIELSLPSGHDFRSDEPEESEVASKLRDQAPNEEDGYFKVKSI